MTHFAPPPWPFTPPPFGYPYGVPTPNPVTRPPNSKKEIRDFIKNMRMWNEEWKKQEEDKKKKEDDSKKGHQPNKNFSMGQLFVLLTAAQPVVMAFYVWLFFKLVAYSQIAFSMPKPL